MVYADVDGNIGFIAPGRVPIRATDNDLHGLAPAPGWEARYDWQGFVPFEQLPRRYNPADGRVVTANQKIVGPDYAPFITSEWSLPYRAERIGQMLDGTPRHSMASFAAMQYDHLSLAARELLPLVRATRSSSARGAEAMRLLAVWDGNMAIDRAEPLIFNAWMRELSRRLLLAPLGPELMRDYFDQRNTQPLLLEVLKNRNGQSHWCRDAASTAQPGTADCATLLTQTLENSLTTLSHTYAGAPAAWRWGNAHTVRMEHRPLSRVPVIGRWFDLSRPVPGDTYTVNVGRYNFRDEVEPFVSRHGAGLRALYDLADLEQSRFIQSTGQSGNRLSPHYDDYLERWAQGQTIPMQTRRAEVDKNRLGTLTLVRPGQLP